MEILEVAAIATLGVTASTIPAATEMAIILVILLAMSIAAQSKYKESKFFIICYVGFPWSSK